MASEVLELIAHQIKPNRRQRYAAALLSTLGQLLRMQPDREGCS